MTAFELLTKIKDDCVDINEKGFATTYSVHDLQNALEELEELKKSIESSVEEIEYALSKPNYADVYLNNAIRYLTQEKGD